VGRDVATIAKKAEDSMKKSIITLFNNDPMGKR
jgi:hypothetical protein